MGIPANPSGPTPPSLDPANFASFTPQDLKAAAAGIKAAGSSLSQDQIMKSLQAEQKDILASLGIINANDPKLPRGNIASTALANVRQTNSWFNASPMVSLAVALQEFMKMISKAKLTEGEILGPKAIQMQVETAKAIGDKIMAAAEKEAEIARNNAIAAIVTAVISFAGAGAQFLLMPKNEKKLMSYSQGFSALTKGLESAVQGGVKFREAELIVDKAQAEKEKVLLDAVLQLVQKRGQDASEAVSNLKEIYNQIIQAWTQMVRDNIEAHRLGKH